jgi:hypothetical protein
MKKLPLLNCFILFVFLSGFSQRGAPPVPGAGRVVHPGSALWREKICDYDTKDREYYCKYFRFYPDGVVIGVSTSGNPQEIKGWFRRPYNDTGSYRIEGSKIKFSLTSHEGTIDYEGEISGYTLRLNIHSHINDYRATKEFVWIAPERQSRKIRQVRERRRSMVSDKESVVRRRLPVVIRAAHFLTPNG